ncbi:hypothetical protein REPUB_Repub14bG0029200 [Reevesia pubescens]
MSVLFWYCRGAGSLKFLRYVKELVTVNEVYLLIIAEPRISGVTADKVIGKLKFDRTTKVDAMGFLGGIWVLQEKALVLSKFVLWRELISIVITNNMGKKWALSAIYRVRYLQIRFPYGVT